MAENNLKELLNDIHSEAERQEFVSILMSGKINPQLYAFYVFNQMKRYERLEDYCDELGVFDTFPELRRYDNIVEDFKELQAMNGQKRPPNLLLRATTDYMKILKEIFEDEEEDSMQLMAHVYTLHMGDLSGGQMIAKKIPGSGKYYQFDADIDELKAKVRETLDDGMEVQARLCFENSIQLFKELMEWAEQNNIPVYVEE